MIRFKLNGKDVESKMLPGARLIDSIREEFGQIGTKEGCSEGECGACAVLIDGELVNSCLVALGSIEGQEIVTIEGYRETDRFKVLDKAYMKAGGVQCGICTPGMILATEALLAKNPHPSREEVKVGLAGNLCRCTGYNMIVDAVLQAAEEGDGLW
ncbi:MAG TPA: (2Fe-2S)-binding protein [Fastidiosipila sp.]|jgi:carbon-monoxide dehydrogenase small subunit|nr:(2Fe-2S)-binding protein [Fastidiosipila sp.]